jgi:cell division protein ZapA
LASVNVTINGRQFRIACEDGQEAHLEKLATDFDALISDLRGRVGEVGDARLTIMAALTIADDLSEMAKKMRVLEEELSALKEARVSSADRTQATQAAVVAAFNAASERLERIAKKLNQSLGSPGLAQG